MKHKLILEDKSLKHKNISAEDLNVVYYMGDGWDVTIGDDTEGNPYISIAVGDNRLLETNPSWKGKILKILLTK